MDRDKESAQRDSAITSEIKRRNDRGDLRCTCGAAASLIGYMLWCEHCGPAVRVKLEKEDIEVINNGWA